MIVSKKVISLYDSPRIEGFFKQKGSEGFELFDAVDGREDLVLLSDYFDFYQYEKNWGYQLPPSHAACSISHFMVIEEFAKSSHPADSYLLVAEDDARFTKNFSNVLHRIEAKSTLYDLIILADGYGEGENPKFLGPSVATVHLNWKSKIFITNGKVFRIGDYDQTVFGAGLYLISKNAAKKYVEFFGKNGGLNWPSDWYHIWAVGSSIKPVLLRPGIATWQGESSLGHETSIDLYNKKISGERSNLPKKLYSFAKIQFRSFRKSLIYTIKSLFN